MKLAVIPVTCKNSPRVTALTKAWFERALGHVQRYFQNQSGGRASFDFQVFDWKELSFTTPEWIAEGTTVGNRVRAEMTADLSGFDRFAVVVDHAESILAATFGSDVLMAARHFTPTILAHELGHAFGANHTQLDSPAGPIEYGGPFCVMGSENGKHSFTDGSLIIDAVGTVHAASGPGMCAPALIQAGWLDLSKHGVSAAGYDNGMFGATTRLAALDGAPREGAGGAPVCCYLNWGDRYIIEYRHPLSRWNGGLPGGQSSQGWLVVYRSPPQGAVTSLQVGTMPAEVGRSLSLGNDFPFVFGAGPLRISVLSVDPAARTVDLRIARKKAEIPEYVVPFRGWREVGVNWIKDGILLWTPSEGLSRVAPDAPSFNLLERISRVENMRELAALSGERNRPALERAATAELEQLREEVASVRLEEQDDVRTSLHAEVQRLEKTRYLEGDALDQHVERLRGIAQRLRHQ